MQEMWVQSLGQEDPLEEEMATHSSILAWKIPGTEEPCGLQSIVSQRAGQDSVTEHISKCVQLCPFNKMLLWGGNPGVSMTSGPNWWHMWILRRTRLNSLLVFPVKFLIGFQAKKSSKTVLASSIWVSHWTKGHVFMACLFTKISPWWSFLVAIHLNVHLSDCCPCLL